MTPDARGLRIGIDLGGTKIEGVLLGPDGELVRERIPAPRQNYDETVRAIAGLALRLKGGREPWPTVGIGVPGSLSPGTGLMQNANSTWLNGRPLDRDIAMALGRPVRIANDANCFALSEAVDGAGAGAKSVFGVILGTGCGGGVVIDRRIVDGPRGIGGEWGHNPLPWPAPEEYPGPSCWCGRSGCMEAWVSGPALAADYAKASGAGLDAPAIADLAEAGDAVALLALSSHASRLARGLAQAVNVLDPEVIVLGGGLSNLEHLYDVLPELMAPHIFSDTPQVTVRPPRWGDASGVRGAAWLWD